MKNKIKTGLILLGVAMILWGLMPLALLALGDKTNGVLDRVDDKSVTTEMTRELRSVQRPTGKFLVKTRVAYRFDVPATVEERLKRASDAPVRTGVRGEDVLYGRTTRPDFTSHESGDVRRVVFLRAYPNFNAVHQPNAMVALGGMRLLGGVVLFAAAWFVNLGPKRAAPKPHAMPPDAGKTT